VAPITVDTPEDLLEAVMKTPGSIGYVENATGMEAVNVVKIKS
jgi:ABC-type phosphate transport system substrate-binding protein